MKKFFLVGIVFFLFSGCAEEMALDKLQGRWGAQSMVHPDSSWSSKLDTCGLEIVFFPCSQPYTATCFLEMREQGLGGHTWIDTLGYTIKGDELAFVDGSVKPKSVFSNTIFKLRRFRWSIDEEMQLDLMRIDTLVIEFRFSKLE